MAFYSFEVFASEEVELPEHGVLLEPGPNVFNALLRDDVQDFVAFLTSHGVRVVRQNRLDDHEPVDATTLDDEDRHVLQRPRLLVEAQDPNADPHAAARKADPPR